MLESTSTELNALAGIDASNLAPYGFGKHALFLVWMGLYEKALEQLAAGTDEQLFTTAAIRAYQFAVTFMHVNVPVADFDAVCTRYRLIPNPVSQIMSRPLLRPGALVDPIMSPTFKVFEEDDTEGLLVYLNTKRSFASFEEFKRFSQCAGELRTHEETKLDAQLCSILLGYGRQRSSEVETLCWEALELRPNNCQVQQSLLMVLEQMGRGEEAAMEATRFASMYGGRTRAKWTATRYRRKAEIEPNEPDLIGKGMVKALVDTRRLADRYLKAADDKQISLYRSTTEGKQAWGELLETEFLDALRVEKVDLEDQPPPSYVHGQAEFADAREFGRQILYLAWSGRYDHVAELAHSATDTQLLQASTLSAIRLAASAIGANAQGRWREAKLTLGRDPKILLLVPQNYSMRLLNPLMDRKWAANRERHSYFPTDDSYEDYVLVSLAAWQLDKDTLVQTSIDSLRKNAADVDALAVAAATLMHFERFECAADLAFRAWRYQPQDAFLRRLVMKTAELAKRDDLIEDLRVWIKQSPLYIPQDQALLGDQAKGPSLRQRFAPKYRNHRALKRSFRRLYRHIDDLLQKASKPVSGRPVDY